MKISAVVSVALFFTPVMEQAKAQTAAVTPTTSGQAVKQVAAAASTAKTSTPEARSAAALALSDEPMFDEGSARRIQDAIARYKTIADRGGWPMIPKDAKFAVGVAGPHDAILRERLMNGGDLDPSEVASTFDANLTAAVKRFQARHGLTASGAVLSRTLAAMNVPVETRIQQLEASAKRIAAIDFGFGSRYMAVNIPAAFAEAIENDKVVRRYRVVVGKSEKPSPTVTAEISNINLNPTWTVPATITRKEIAAHMLKDPDYLVRMHMQTLDARENPVDPRAIDWSSEKNLNVIVRQEPGEWNALGRVRIDMPNAYAVYMHDTNQKTLFSNDYRFDSHGCVRVDNVRDLAEWLLSDAPEWNRAAIDAAIATGERKDIKMPKKVPVAWIYLTGWMTRDQIVQFRDDVYDQDAQLTELTPEEKAFFDQASDLTKTRSAK